MKKQKKGCDEKMKNKTIKIFGIGAVAIFALMTLSPIITVEARKTVIAGYWVLECYNGNNQIIATFRAKTEAAIDRIASDPRLYPPATVRMNKYHYGDIIITDNSIIFEAD